jgi:hypothetical protein
MKLYIKLNMYSSKTFVRWWKKHKKKNVRKTTISSLLCIVAYWLHGLVIVDTDWVNATNQLALAFVIALKTERRKLW